MKKIATFKDKAIADLFIRHIPQSVNVKTKRTKEGISVFTNYAGYRKGTMVRLFG